jgi:uncharacterized protein
MLTRVFSMQESFVRIGRQVSATALTNARRGSAALARSNADRGALQPLTADEPGDPGDLRRLSREECLHLLASRAIGRYAFVESARALDVVPVNYVTRPDGSVLFRSGPGPKLSAADRHDVVAFQVDDIDEPHHTGWSVLVVGRARRLTYAEGTSLGHVPSPWANGPRNSLVLIEPTRIEGRRLT